ncbi:MAG TPA: 2-aminoethylphosphonate--pyruvate transaminase [Bryobacteraceae bacterium]|nr:2-aminoethylphosphonate--pyruvate transaminase [Bryobacteraceae bacterium]
MEKQLLDRSKDKALFTPGPLTTSRTVKQAMLRDLGSRDSEFIALVREIRRRLLEIGGVAGRGYEAIPMQGSGTFALEAVVSSTIPPGGKLLVALNGAYGRRIEQIARVLKIDVLALAFPETQAVDPQAVALALERDAAITHVAVVHCETTTGILNPVREIGAVVRHAQRLYFVDAMSSFGAVPLNLADWSIDYLVSSANKCIEGVPGFAFVLARREALLATSGFARSLSLDLLAQWKGLELDGQFRFTPPTHALLAFHQALIELEQEGGVEARAARYRQNYRTLVEGMRALGFREYLAPELQGYIITSFLYPEDPNFRFAEFYARLNDKGYVIYPGKVSQGNCFRIGHIGRIFPGDVQDLLAAVQSTLAAMGLDLSRPQEPCAVSL